jgi:hypothetical protein
MTSDTQPTIFSSPPASIPSETEVDKFDIAEEFIINSPTFIFDGIEGSLSLVGYEDGTGSRTFTFNYDTRHPGHGDRNGQILTQVITKHTAVIVVDVDRDIVISAICDETWDMLNQTSLPVHVSGIVINYFHKLNTG